MGQYYKIAVKIGDGKVRYFVPNLKKITVHSHLDGVVPELIGQMLHGRRGRVAWIGDYAQVSEISDITNGDTSYSKRSNTRGWRWPHREAGFKMRETYLVNHTQKVFIDMRAYCDFMDMIPTKEAYNPLPLLTAIGNGRGGGDYMEIYRLPSEESVGSWAWNEISVEDEVPEGYSSVLPVFFLPKVNAKGEVA